MFFFDNATNHTAFAADALRVQDSNPSPGGVQSQNMRNGWNPLSGKTQYMHTLVRGKKVANGIREVLKERGLW